MLSRPSKSWPKTFKILPKWRNFAKSGHTNEREGRLLATRSIEPLNVLLSVLIQSVSFVLNNTWTIWKLHSAQFVV